LRASSYCTAVREGGAEEWEFVWKRYSNSSLPANERASLLRALGCTRKIWLLNRRVEYLSFNIY